DFRRVPPKKKIPPPTSKMQLEERRAAWCRSRKMTIPGRVYRAGNSRLSRPRRNTLIPRKWKPTDQPAHGADRNSGFDKRSKGKMGETKPTRLLPSHLSNPERLDITPNIYECKKVTLVAAFGATGNSFSDCPMSLLSIRHAPCRPIIRI